MEIKVALSYSQFYREYGNKEKKHGLWSQKI